MGLFVAIERPDVERRGALADEAVVICLCILIVLDVEDWRECDEDEGTRECGALGRAEGEDEGGRNGAVGMELEETVRECW